jgi:hypothetical protein
MTVMTKSHQASQKILRTCCQNTITAGPTKRRTMPTIEENKDVWNKAESFPEAGEEWSASWGGSDMTRWHSIYPRIHLFVPTDTIFEIAPGFGRMTTYLKDICKRLVVVDMSEKCIEACRKRFADVKHISYFVDDGKSD